jgi:hypothetical protein
VPFQYDSAGTQSFDPADVLTAYLETYRHRFDLFVKGGAGLLVSVGFVAGVRREAGKGGSGDRSVQRFRDSDRRRLRFALLGDQAGAGSS